MAIDPPKETFTLEAKWNFNSDEERTSFRNWLMTADLRNPRPQPITMKFDKFFSHCKKCGRPSWMQTLGSGVMHQEKDECRPAYARACDKWRSVGGWRPNVEMGSRDNV